jgi:hypothetical protein
LCRNGVDPLWVAQELIGSTYAYEILPLIDWWANLQTAIHCDHDHGNNTAAGEAWSRPYVAMHKVFVTLAGGMTELYLEDPNGSAITKMLRRYRTWTRMLCAAVQEVWSAIDLSELDGLV